MKSIASIFLLSLLAASANSQDTAAYFQRLEKVLQKQVATDPAYKIRLDELKEIRTLFKRYYHIVDSIKHKSSVPAAKYLNERNNYLRLLDSAATSKDANKQVRILHFIADDLICKLDDQRGHAGKFSELVTVTVVVWDRTRSKALPGFSVYVKPELSTDERLTETFNPTTNAVKKIQPGRKLFWVEKKGYEAIPPRREAIYYYMASDSVEFIIR